MKINSNRILLRDFLETDWKIVHELYLKPETVKYNPSGYPESEQSTEQLVLAWAKQNTQTERRNYTFHISDRLDNSFIGAISLDFGKANYKNLKYGTNWNHKNGERAMQQKHYMPCWISALIYWSFIG